MRGVPRAKRGRRQRTEDGEELLASSLTLAGMADGKALLGQYERQYPYVPGRRFAADFAWPEKRLLVEVQGGVWTAEGHTGHAGGIGIMKDNGRLNLATMNGWRLLRFSTRQCMDAEIGETLEIIERALFA